MSHRDILAMLASADGDEGVIAAARTLADQADGRATALLFEIEPNSALRRRMFEGVLFGSGRPLMIVPPDWKAGPIGAHVVIGWNAKREAARALADARPLIERAEKITIVTVDAKPGPSGHGQAPGADVAAHLARCGVNVEVRNVDGMGRDEAAALIDECRALGADLLVVGGYGRARLQEITFGGVTRGLIGSAPLPVLMAH